MTFVIRFGFNWPVPEEFLLTEYAPKQLGRMKPKFICKFHMSRRLQVCSKGPVGD